MELNYTAGNEEGAVLAEALSFISQTITAVAQVQQKVGTLPKEKATITLD